MGHEANKPLNDIESSAIDKPLCEAISKLEKRLKNESPIPGTPTGLSALDKSLGGLRGGDLIVIAGRPGSGKSSLAANIAESATVSHGVNTLIFTAEMPADRYTLRLLASLARINLQRLDSQNIEIEEWPRLTSAVGVLSDAPLFLISSSRITLCLIRDTIAEFSKANKKPGLIVVDYLQLMFNDQDVKSETRADVLSEIARELKSLALEYQTTIIAISQLNRLGETRDSGAIKENADIFIQLVLDEAEKNTWGTNATVTIKKQRNGPVDRFKLMYTAEYVRFDDAVELSSTPI